MRKAGQLSQTTIEIIIVIGIVIVINILGQYFYKRADLTEDKQFTLAKSSREIVSDVPDLVQIKAYVTADLPPILQQHEQNLRDLLEEYRASASTKVTIQFLHPEDLSTDEISALNAKGIPENPVQIIEGDERSYKNVYMGLEIAYMGNYKTIPFVPSASNREYEITSAILKLTSDTDITIGFLTGHGEMSTQSEIKALSESLKELYTVKDVDLKNGDKVPEDVNTLIIPQPMEPFTNRHKYVIDQFLMRGGKLIVLSSGIQEDQMSNQAQMKICPLDSLLSEYGVKIHNDLVADRGYNMQIPARMGNFQVMVQYPLFPAIRRPDGFPSDSPATRDLNEMALPYVSSLELLYDKISKETEILELAKSSAYSYSYPAPIDLDPTTQKFDPPGGESDFKPQLVAVQINGKFKSAFAGDPIPAYDSDPEAPLESIPMTDDEPMLSESPETSLVVVGNAIFLIDNVLKNVSGNKFFIENLLEILNIGDKLVGIRSRAVTSKPIDPKLTAPQKNGLRFWGYGAVPLILTLFGVARFYLKSQRKRLMQALLDAESKSK
ncbi:MAG: GldG family protein [bacterium]